MLFLAQLRGKRIYAMNISVGLAVYVRGWHYSCYRTARRPARVVSASRVSAPLMGA